MKWFAKPLIFLLMVALISIPSLITGFANLALAETASNDTDASLHYEVAAKFLFWRPDLYEQAGLNKPVQTSSDSLRVIQLLTKARQKGALSSNGQISLGDAYFANGQTDQAVNIWESLVNEKQTTLVVSPRLAQVYHAQKQFAQEARILSQWLKIDQNNPDACERLGRLLAVTAAPEALPLLEIAAAASPQAAARLGSLVAAMKTPDDDLAYQLVKAGQALAQLDEWPLAEQAFARAVNANNRYANAWAWLGLARQYNSTPDAQQALEYALKLDLQSAAIHAMFGTYWQQAGRPEEARKQFTVATQLEPGNPVWWLGLGGAASQIDLSDALNAYIQAVNLAPHEARYWYALASFCVEKNVYVEDYGLNAALRAFALDPKDPANMDMLGRAQIAIGQTGAAEVMFKKALTESGDDPSSPVYSYHLHLGLLYLQTNRAAQAKSEFEQTLELDPVGPYGIQAKKLLERYFP